MNSPTRRLRAATLAAAAVLVLSACADDDDGLQASPSLPSATPTPTPAATVDEFCEAKLAVDAAFLAGGPPEEAAATSADETASPSLEETASPSLEETGSRSLEEVTAALQEQYGDTYDELADTAQDEVADEVDALVQIAEESISQGNGEFFLDQEFATAESEVDEYLVENCGYEQMEVTTADYEFNDLPSNIPAGETAITVTNEGEEFHELLLIPIADDVDLSVEELLELSDEERMTMTGPPVSVTLVTPGDTATSFADLDEGRYAVLCFISKDSTAENDFSGDGPPHVSEGMYEELTVGDIPTEEPTSDTESSGTLDSDSTDSELTDSELTDSDSTDSGSTDAVTDSDTADSGTGGY